MDPMAAAHALVRSMPAGRGRRRRGHHHRRLRPRLPPLDRARALLLLQGRRPRVGHAGGARREPGLRRAVPVLCVVGDGSAMYSPQALWTAAHEQLPVVFAVVNNRQYLILKNNLRAMKGATRRHGPVRGHGHRRPARRLRRPGAVDGRAVATLVDQAGDIGDAVEAAVDRGRPPPPRAPHHRAGMTDVVLALAGRAARRATAGSSSTTSTGRSARASAGWCSAATARARRRSCGSPSLYLHPSAGEVEVLGERLGRTDVRTLRTARRLRQQRR